MPLSVTYDHFRCLSQTHFFSSKPEHPVCCITSLAVAGAAAARTKALLYCPICQVQMMLGEKSEGKGKERMRVYG